MTGAPSPYCLLGLTYPRRSTVSHSRAWRRGRRGGAAVVACATVFSRAPSGWLCLLFRLIGLCNLVVAQGAGETGGAGLREGYSFGGGVNLDSPRKP